MAEESNPTRNKILELVKDHYSEAFPQKEFVPGQSPIPVSGKVFDEDETYLGVIENFLLLERIFSTDILEIP